MNNIDFDRLSNRQLSILSQIAVGHGLGHPQRTVDSLKKRGYIQSHVVALNGTNAVCCYRMPEPVKIAWQEWRAESEIIHDA